MLTPVVLVTDSSDETCANEEGQDDVFEVSILRQTVRQIGWRLAFTIFN